MSHIHPQCGAVGQQRGSAPWGSPSSASPRSTVPMPVRISIRADLHVDMGPDGNLQLLTSACRPTVQAQSTREAERSAPSFPGHRVG